MFGIHLCAKLYWLFLCLLSHDLVTVILTEDGGVVINRLVYVSELKLSVEDPKYTRMLVNVLMKARIYNKSKSITSVLFVSDRTCIQVLEGDSNELGKLMFKVSRDDRHHNVKVLYNKKVSERLYGDWSMKLLTTDTSLYNESIVKFRLSDEDGYTRVSPYSNGIFVCAEPCKNERKEVKTSNSIGLKKYTNMRISIKSWPKSSQLQLTNSSMRLCSLLMGKWVAFDELSRRLIFKSDIELSHNLEKLDFLGILLVKPMSVVNLSLENTGRQQPESKPHRFSQLLKNFIASGNGK